MTLTVTFTEAQGNTGGYLIKYHKKGTNDPYQSLWTASSPAVITGVEDASYEGTVSTSCGDGSFGIEVPFEVIVPLVKTITGTVTIGCNPSGPNQSEINLVFNIPNPLMFPITVEFGYCSTFGQGFNPSCNGTSFVPNTPYEKIGDDCPTGYFFTVPTLTNFTVTGVRCNADTRIAAPCLNRQGAEFYNLYMKVVSHNNVILNLTATNNVTFTQIF